MAIYQNPENARKLAEQYEHFGIFPELAQSMIQALAVGLNPTKRYPDGLNSTNRASVLKKMCEAMGIPIPE